MPKFLFPALLGTLLAIAPAIEASDLKSGAEVYRMHCASCHGARGKSTMAGAPDFDRPGSLLQSDQSLLPRIQSGKNACPAYRGILTEQKIFDVIAYIRTLGF